jgi:hypothetical protein
VEQIPDMTIEIGNTLQRQLRDVALTVRAPALDALTEMIRLLDSHMCSEIIKQIIDLSGSFLLILSRRIEDGKLIVRRAALSCLQELVLHSVSIVSLIVLDLISSRVRDCATSPWQHAVKVLHSAVNRYPDCESIRTVWLDSILPLIIDPSSNH